MGLASVSQSLSAAPLGLPFDNTEGEGGGQNVCPLCLDSALGFPSAGQWRPAVL